jgi:DNA repair protein RecN (Recombination protein N)
VLCVTHLPQIAALADVQFYIEKSETAGRTFPRVTPLDRPGRVRELARLTAGVHVTPETLVGAEKLLEAAEKSKNPR